MHPRVKQMHPRVKQTHPLVKQMHPPRGGQGVSPYQDPQPPPPSLAAIGSLDAGK
jgi:hypothetical protein